MVLGVLKTTTTRKTFKLMVVHSIVDFNGQGQPTLCNQDLKKKKPPTTTTTLSMARSAEQ
jgi:hypothetical protein